MKLIECKIYNYRSIRELTINFDNDIQTLVGFNEAGKSNILRALSLLDTASTISHDDVRDVKYTEDPVDEALVRFVFSADKKTSELAYKTIKEKFHGGKLPSITFKKKKYTLEEFCFLRNECLYSVDIEKESRSFRYWTLPKALLYKVTGNWKRIPDDWINNDVFSDKKIKYINIDEFPDFSGDSSLEDLTPKMINKEMGSILIDVLQESLPSCITWKYSESNILPGTIEIESFVADPDSCVPLKNIFLLAGYDDIDASIELAENKKNGMKNLLRRLREADLRIWTSG